MTTPAWIEKFYKQYWIEKLPKLVQDEIKGFISEIIASELQAVLGEEKDKFHLKNHAKGCGECSRNFGWNSHREACLKKAKERGILK